MAAEPKGSTTDGAAEHDAAGTADIPPPPPQAQTGLLDYITSHSLDEDYAHVAQRHSLGQTPGDPVNDAGDEEPRHVRPGVSALIILGLFGLLIATAAVQTSRNAADAANGRSELISQIKARSATVDATRERIVSVREDIATLQTQSLDATTEGRAMSSQLDQLGGNTGRLAVEGPGVKVVVDDAPTATSAQEEVLDKDLQKLVNALWESGVEAISINGQRLTNLSAIRHAGSAITVNYRSLARPYVVSAIGDPDSIPARFIETEHGAAWLDLQAAYGLQFNMTSEESLTLPAANRLALRYATSTGEPQ